MIKVTKKQDEALYKFYSLTGEELKNQLDLLMRAHGKFAGVYEPLNEIPFDEFAELLVTEQYGIQRTVEEVVDDFISDSKGKIEPSESALRKLKQTLQMEGLL